MKILILFSFLVSGFAVSKSVRSISTDDVKMSPIYLKMSHSTVLRFESRPKKIILGNSNYISAEFTGNDVTLQPLDTLNTNLFVYTDDHTYGFHLKVGAGRHDDLVRVRWHERMAVVYTQKKVRVKPIGKIIRLSKDISLKLVATKYIDGGRQLLDCELTNQSEIPLDTRLLETYLTRSDIKLFSQRSAFDRDLVYHGATAKLRFVLKKVQRRGFTLNLWKEGKRHKIIVGGRYL